MKRLSVCAVVFALSLVIQACSETRPNLLADPPAKPTSQKGMQSADDFMIGPEDVLDIVVWKEPQLSKVSTVRPDGKISLPLIGDIQASGQTPVMLQNEITKRLSEFKQSPEVSVIVQQVNSYNIYVAGEVTHPGKYKLNSPTTVIQAISLAGGFTTFASEDVKVLRMEGKNNQRVIKLRYKDLMSDGGNTKNFILKPGDTVVAP